MKKENAVTMVALVITIIVLLILVGIVVTFVIGENGIIHRSSEAKLIQKRADVKQKIELTLLDMETEEIKKGETLTIDKIVANLANKIENTTIVKETQSTAKGVCEDINFEINEKKEVAIITDIPTVASLSLEENREEYTISNLQQLKTFRDEVNAGVDFSNKKVRLTANIDVNGNATSIWTPIGVDRSHAFTGVFDGENHKISNIYISNADYAGLFGYATEASIQNLAIENITITGTAVTAGGLIANNYSSANTIVENVVVTGNITLTGAVSNVAGVGVILNGKVNNCRSSVTMNINSTGYLLASGVTAGGEVRNSYNIGNITVNGNEIAGTAGVSVTPNLVENCYNKGKIEVTSASRNSITMGVGGILGSFSDGKQTCTKSYNEGKIKCIAVNAKVGGIVGTANNGTVESCYNKGEIEAITATIGTTSDLAVGGIGGTIAVVNDCYNLGNIILTNYLSYEADTAGIAGIIGITPNRSAGGAGNATITNCYNSGKMTSNFKKAAIVVSSESLNNKIAGAGEVKANLQNCYYLTGTAPGGIHYYYYVKDGDTTNTILADEQGKYEEKNDIQLKALASELGNAYQASNTGYPILTWQTK